MNKEHWALVIFWILYCVLHSFLADVSVKEKIKKLTGNTFKYYRLAYSLFAAASLIFLMWYQFSVVSSHIFLNTFIQLGVSLFLIFPGLIVMIICIKKYFYELSGIQVLKKEEQQITLQKQGLHKYVRHPLYAGTLLFVWGLFLMFPLLSNLLACLIIMVYILIGIKLEEKKLVIEFGDEYNLYAKTVPMLIPNFRSGYTKK